MVIVLPCVSFEKGLSILHFLCYLVLVEKAIHLRRSNSVLALQLLIGTKICNNPYSRGAVTFNCSESSSCSCKGLERRGGEREAVGRDIVGTEWEVGALAEGNGRLEERWKKGSVS